MRNISHNKKYLAAILFMATLFFPPIGFTQTLKFRCSYSTYADSEGFYKLEELHTINFTAYIEKKEALMEVNDQKRRVHITHANEDGIVFMRKIINGSFELTTIDSTLNSAHSRNDLLFGMLMATQFYGKCKKINA